MKREMLPTPEPCLERADAFRRARARVPAAGRLVPPAARGRRRLRSHGVCLHATRGRPAHLRAVDPDAQSRQRQGRRHRSLRARGGRSWASRPRFCEEDYILQIALLDPEARGEVEKDFVEPYFDIDQGGLVPTVDDYRDVPLLEVQPPDVARYFVRVKPDVLDRFAAEKGLFSASLSERGGGR